MRNKFIALFVALGLSLSVASPAKAWYGGWGYGGWGYGGGAAIAGMAVGGLLAGALMAQSYGYPYGYGYGYGVPVYNYPAYAYPVATPVPVYRSAPVRKQVIIKNSPGATVIEEDDIFGW